jgi:hypothetical protein
MLKKLWRENRTLILVSLLVYLVLTLLVLLASYDPSDMPFDYQVR